jgi:hypothetical protein
MQSTENSKGRTQQPYYHTILFRKTVSTARYEESQSACLRGHKHEPMQTAPQGPNGYHFRPFVFYMYDLLTHGSLAYHVLNC